MIACLGEILLRLAAPGREALLQTPRLNVHVGGAEANVAVALARLGHRAAMISRVPDNPLGEAAVGHLRRYGVDTAGVATGPGRMGLYFLAPGAGLRASAITYDREASSFALAGPGDFDWDARLAGADRLHLSGITPALGPRSAELAFAVAEAAAARDIPISFDGNYRANLWRTWDSDPRAALRRLVEQASEKTPARCAARVHTAIAACTPASSMAANGSVAERAAALRASGANAAAMTRPAITPIARPPTLRSARMRAGVTR